jgi:hypothetical protein
MLANGCGIWVVGDHGILQLVNDYTGNPFTDIGSREEDMQRYSKLLSTMDVSHSRRVRNDRIRDKWNRLRGFGNVDASLVVALCSPCFFPLRQSSRLKARSPARVDNIAHDAPIPQDMAFPPRCELGHESRVLDHIGHQVDRTAFDIEEFDALTLDKFGKGAMCGQSNSVAVLDERGSEHQERLYVPS